ncbi:hypothetical protein [Roseivivax sp. THAF197b]|uniref:hypothetical protein n=1 Tax=Roseivivax sp. THAF197b TaxID=2588299 RepID=UPI0012685F97|nr:hypothetical protein [Roseivivax sp. THAF197b]QFS81794.1 hypothetical protein FIV09_03040 [Roseivivax sp. THAF197b]
MTALTQYQRLEASGLWRADAEAQRREVVVSMGDASLTITDMKDQPVAHWSLAAVRRATSKGDLPAIYHPDGDRGETLELDATASDMIAAIDKVLRAIERSRPRPGKLRLWISGGIAGLAVLTAVIWLPGALLDYSSDVVPPVKRNEIGTALLDRITRVAGQPCTAPEAEEALRALGRRVLGPERGGDLVVLRGGIAQTAHLPGGRILLNHTLVEDPDDPDVTAGYILAEAVRAKGSDPLVDLLESVGLFATLKLLTTGEVPPAALDAYAEDLLSTARAPVDPAVLLPAFEAAELRSSPYAYALDLTGESTLNLIEADPRAAEGSRLVLTDAEWVRLQGICTR